MQNRFLLATMIAVFSVPMVVKADVRQSESMSLPTEAKVITSNSVQLVLPQDRNVRLAPDKILKTKSVGGGYVMQIVETKQGFRYKRLLDANNRRISNPGRTVMALIGFLKVGRKSMRRTIQRIWIIM